MRLSFATLLSATYYIYLVSNLRISRGLPTSVADVPSISFFTSHHSSYIDWKVRQNTYISLNHELYHQRNVIHFSNTSITAFTSSPLPATIPPSFPHTTSNISSSRHSSLANVLPGMKAAKTDNADIEDWSKQVGLACTEALTIINGHASNPSGISACYNIRTFNNTTGAFQSDLRLYRIATPTGDWMRLSSASVDVGVEFDGASDVEGGSKTSGQRRKREVIAIEVPVVRRYQARDIWSRQAGGVAPKMLENMTFVGTIDVNIMVDNMSDDMMRVILTPNITLSGAMQSGTLISTELSMEDASFVTRVFAIPNTRNKTSIASCCNPIA